MTLCTTKLVFDSGGVTADAMFVRPAGDTGRKYRRPFLEPSARICPLATQSASFRCNERRLTKFVSRALRSSMARPSGKVANSARTRSKRSAGNSFGIWIYLAQIRTLCANRLVLLAHKCNMRQSLIGPSVHSAWRSTSPGRRLRLVMWTPCRREHENCGVQDNDYNEPSQPYNR